MLVSGLREGYFDIRTVRNNPYTLGLTRETLYEPMAAVKDVAVFLCGAITNPFVVATAPVATACFSRFARYMTTVRVPPIPVLPVVAAIDDPP